MFVFRYEFGIETSRKFAKLEENIDRPELTSIYLGIKNINLSFPAKRGY